MNNNVIIVGVGEIGVSNRPGYMIKTFALGSCVAVIMYDLKSHVVGMVHIALPDSNIDPIKAQEKPGYFADTGIPTLIQKINKLRYNYNNKGISNKGIIVKIAGGSNIMDPNNRFNIGKRNILAVKKVLWSYGMGPLSEDIGKDYSRTVTVIVDTGEVIISSPGKPCWKI